MDSGTVCQHTRFVGGNHDRGGHYQLPGDRSSERLSWALGLRRRIATELVGCIDGGHAVGDLGTIDIKRVRL